MVDTEPTAVDLYSYSSEAVPPVLQGTVTLDPDGRAVIPPKLVHVLTPIKIVLHDALVTPADGSRYLAGLVRCLRGRGLYAVARYGTYPS